MAADSGIPDDVREVILQHIRSVTQIELLTVLVEKGGAWPVEALARELRIEPTHAADELRPMLDAGFVERDATSGAWSFPTGTEASARARRLVETYKVRRVSVTTLVYSRPNDRILTFAEAFQLRERKKP